MAPMRRAALAAVFVVAYVALDRISFIHSINALNITPWNPPPGLGLALLLLWGARWAPLVFFAAVAADVAVRGIPSPWWGAVAADAAMALVYATVAAVLRGAGGLNPALTGLRDVLVLAAAAVAGAALAGLGYVGAHVAAGVVPADLLGVALSRYWIGDMIGVAVLTPAILLLVRAPPRPRPLAVLEAAGQGLALAAALWLVFGLGGSGNYQFFYLLFPPLIWAATRFGLMGAALGNVAAQVGLILVFRAEDAGVVTTFQFLMLALAMVTLVLGAAITERARIQAQLQARQDELAHMTRLSTAGEMAAALAHELNQPLLAAIAFTRGAQRLLAADPPDPAKARGAMDRAVAESQRAGDIIRSLREFIGSERRIRQRVAVAALTAETLALAGPECARRGIRLSAAVDKSLPAVHVDRVQMTQVLLNLVRNGMDAMAGGGDIVISAEADGTQVAIQVADTGPGIGDEVAAQLFQPFNTSKAAGMGLGLTICRSFVEAHGGRLWLERNGPGGAVFRFVLPVPDRDRDED
ncbi:MAG: sensor histidine kinase [Bacteroidales bacterium]